jgi:hypothetical protein
MMFVDAMLLVAGVVVGLAFGVFLVCVAVGLLAVAFEPKEPKRPKGGDR